MLAEAMFIKRRDIPIDFAISLDSDQFNEDLHKAMKSRNHYAVSVKKKATNDRSQRTHASHRLKDHEKLIDLLEKMTGAKKIDYLKAYAKK